MVASEAPSSCGPQPQAQLPPMAQAPSPTVVISIPLVPSGRRGSVIAVLPPALPRVRVAGRERRAGTAARPSIGRPAHSGRASSPRSARVSNTPLLRTPRISMHRCRPSTTTATPRACSSRIRWSATCAVRRSCNCGRRA